MRLSFITQFKIEFLLPFTGCRKLLGKMPDKNVTYIYIYIYIYISSISSILVVGRKFL